MVTAQKLHHCINDCLYNVCLQCVYIPEIGRGPFQKANGVEASGKYKRKREKWGKKFVNISVFLRLG